MNQIPEISPENNVETDQQTVDPVLQEYQTEAKQEEWVKELTAARDERKNFDTAGVETIQRYEGKGGNGPQYNLYSANTEIKLSALFNRTPEPSVRRRFMDARDDAGRVASDMIQRVVSIELDSDNFDQKFKQMLFDWKVPGMGIGWVRFDEQREAVTESVQEIDPLSGLAISVEKETERVVEQNALIDYVAWDDLLWAPCQVWTDCRWVARRVPMSKEAINHRFGETCPPEVLAEISFETKKSGSSTGAPSDKLKPKNSTKKTADVYEIWDRESKLICWVNEGSSVPLDVKQDTNEFPNFFPTPLPPLGRFTTSSTIPRSDYSLVQDQYRQLDDLFAKANGLIECIKVRFAYDSSFKSLGEIFDVDEGKGVPVDNWGEFSEKGGVANRMQFVPLQDYVQSLALTIQQIAGVKQQIFEIEGIADYMRGESQKYDSAAAIQQKGTFASTRLGADQKQTAKYIEQLIRLQVHLISKFYEPEILVDHAGALPELDMQHVPDAVKLLKSNFERNFRLMVSVDSIQDVAWKVEELERQGAVRAIGALIQQVGPLVAQRPELAPLVIELARYAVAGTKGAQQIEGVLDSTLAMIQQQLTSGQQEPKPPSEAEIKASMAAQKNQTDKEIAQNNNQTKLAIASSEAQSRQFNDQQELINNERDASVKQSEIQLKAAELMMKGTELQHRQAHDVASMGK